MSAEEPGLVEAVARAFAGDSFAWHEWLDEAEAAIGAVREWDATHPSCTCTEECAAQDSGACTCGCPA